MPERRSISDMQQKIVNDNLVAAAMNNDREKIDLCLKKGADIDARGTWGNRTSLMVAVAYSRPELVEFLLTKQPDLFLKDSGNKTAFDLAEDLSDVAVKKKINLLLLAALPDAEAPAAPDASAAPAAATPEEIPVLKPIEFDRQKKGGKSFQL